MAEVKWIKVSTDMFSNNRKIKQIELMPEGDAILVIWLKLLLLAGNINDGGAIYLTPEIPYTDEMLANELRKPLTTVRMALSIFEKFGMIEIVDDILHLSSWEKYQNIEGLDKIREQNRLRKQKQRENQKQLSDVSRDSHVTVTGCHAIEEEREEDKEKEYHSFNRSAGCDQDEEDFLSPIQPRSAEEQAHEEAKERTRMKYMSGTLGQGYLFLSQEQFESLLDELSYDEFHKYVDIVVQCEKNGKKFRKKSHYQAILDMARKDRRT